MVGWHVPDESTPESRANSLKTPSPRLKEEPPSLVRWPARRAAPPGCRREEEEEEEEDSSSSSCSVAAPPAFAIGVRTRRGYVPYRRKNQRKLLKQERNEKTTDHNRTRTSTAHKLRFTAPPPAVGCIAHILDFRIGSLDVALITSQPLCPH